MSAEPEKFHVGMIDFFSIILPGAILAFHLRVPAQQYIAPAFYPAPQSDAEGWVIFLVASYVLGHFVFVAGSQLDRYYDRLREKFVPLGTDTPLKIAGEIRKACLPYDHAINTFQWAKCRLALTHPNALAHVNRFEADSKFFRSLFVILIILCASFFHTGAILPALACLVLAGLSLYRYGEQRFKSTRQAYWYLITLHAELDKPCCEQRPKPDTKRRGLLCWWE